ncbi:hypothetical protein QR680_014154 [Steinernema hermaphroditum]|uniref:Peptidase C1A papain C-terminal domain-containing protein n=1 Tax=Steinernema hermaphroditum TaxID=289476 RepID=A0AA39I7V7_9BILA|nr:hypothetical protein QR680_014154 [Steinernema hermaphroditum]
MYYVAPHSGLTKVVAAKGIMYRTLSYHQDFTPSEDLPSVSVVSSNDGLTADSLLEQQIALIKRITALTKSLQQRVLENSNAEDAKKKKAAKKAEKATKKEAAPPRKANDVPCGIKDGKPTPRDVGQSIPCCTPPRFLELDIPEKASWGSLQIECTPADSCWMENAETLAASKAFNIKFVPNQKFFRATIERNGTTETIRDRVNFWQFIGECLGLYSDAFPLLALQSDRWLTKANDVIDGLVSQDKLMREASSFLSRWDSLGTADAYKKTYLDKKDESGYVTDVKDQGQCGSCWSFSSTGALEGQQKRATGKLGCDGGIMHLAFAFIKEEGGVDSEESYPYTANDSAVCKFKTDMVGATDDGMVMIPEGDEEALKAAVATVGPISVAIDASHRSFQFAGKGVYYEPECSDHQLDHAVLVVGYGTDPVEGDFWIVKNSWGTEWADGGYIRMARNRDNHCGIASVAVYPVVKSDDTPTESMEPVVSEDSYTIVIRVDFTSIVVIGFFIVFFSILLILFKGNRYTVTEKLAGFENPNFKA